MPLPIFFFYIIFGIVPTTVGIYVTTSLTFTRLKGTSMKHVSTVVATALGLALATGALAGCGGQQASTTDNPAASAEQAAVQTTEELVAEFKQAVADVPEYTSATVTLEEISTSPNESPDGEETIESKTVYKFDKSGGQLKTSANVDMSGLKLEYITDGDNAVFVSDGPVYSGTTEQFDLNFSDGLEAFLLDSIGDLNVLADCAADAEKMESKGLTFYTFTLDPEKYIASDEALKTLADYGTTVKEAMVTVGFDEDGTIASIDRTIDYGDTIASKHMVFSDYNSTVVEAMPEATKTFEEMEADSQAKLDALYGEDDAATEEATKAE